MLKISNLAAIFLLSIISISCATSQIIEPESNAIKASESAQESPPIVTTATAIAKESPAPTEEQASDFPLAAIEILAPSGDQAYSSPLNVSLLLQSGKDELVELALFGNDGRLIVRKIIIFPESVGKQYLREQIAFELSDASEISRLVISTLDNYGRLRSLSSVTLELVNMPIENAAVGALFIEKIWIQIPQSGASVISGEIEISGIAMLESERPLFIQLLSRDGKVLTFAEIYPKKLAGQERYYFELTFDYSVNEAQWLQLGIMESGLQIPGDVHYSSLEFQLLPPITSDN